MVRRIFTSTLIPIEEKQKYLAKLEEIDTTDWMDKTRFFCRAAVPDAHVKRELWAEYFEKEDLNWSYHNYLMSFAGWGQIT